MQWEDYLSIPDYSGDSYQCCSDAELEFGSEQDPAEEKQFICPIPIERQTNPNDVIQFNSLRSLKEYVNNHIIPYNYSIVLPIAAIGHIRKPKADKPNYDSEALIVRNDLINVHPA